MPIDKSKKSNIAIWKIDTTIDVFAGKNTEEIINIIKDSYANSELRVLNLKTGDYKDKKIKVLQKVRFSKGWVEFLKNLLPDNLSEEQEKEIFYNLNKDLILFVLDDNDIYAITSGAGYFVIQSYIDERFPFEVAKRMLTGEFKSAEMRDLTGLVYSQSRNFRRNYNFSRREAFGKVWKKLTGKINTEIVKDSQFIADFLAENEKKSFNADIKSSFTFRKSINLEQAIDIIKEIQSLLQNTLTADQKKAFSFLDTLKEITNKKEKEELKNCLLESIYNFIKSESTESDFDFCHPKEVVKFLHGSNYEISDDLSWDEAPDASEILIKLREADDRFIDKSNLESFKDKFLMLSLSFKEDDDNEYCITDELWKYFHGEIDCNDKKYFFIDGKWFEVVGDFLERLFKDFKEEIFGEKSILTDEIPFIDWTFSDEGSFNIEQAKQDNFYFGDKIFLRKSERGKIELFDLMYLKDNKIFLIQVKDGFGASIRDACSQVQMAAEIIENNLSSNNTAELDKYYEEFVKNEQNKEVSKDDFMSMLKKDRCYVLAFATKEEFSESNYSDKKFQSEIAKFEILGLSHDFRASERKLLISNIKQQEN